jgi:hypothetical protein
MFVFVQDASKPIASSDPELGHLGWISDWGRDQLTVDHGPGRPGACRRDDLGEVTAEVLAGA